MAKRFVFVVGAGASREFNLPTGRELLNDIASSLDGDQRRFVGSISDAIERDTSLAAIELSKLHSISHESSRRQLNEALLWIAKTCPIAPSIDNLLHAHKDNIFRVVAGKLLIAHTLLKAEGHSLLRADPQPYRFRSFLTKSVRYRERGAAAGDFKDRLPAESWLGELFWLLAENRGFDQFLEALENYTFISFNYDRCIAHFLANAAMTYYDRQAEDAERVAERIRVVFPYGSLGALTADMGNLVGYGDPGPNLYTVAMEIRTFTEGLANADLATHIQTALSSADCVVFLGFGFLDLNLRLLFQDQKYSVKRVIGTALGLSAESRDIVREKLTDSLFYGDRNPEHRSAFFPITNPDLFELTSCTARELMDKHRLYLRGLK